MDADGALLSLRHLRRHTGNGNGVDNALHSFSRHSDDGDSASLPSLPRAQGDVALIPAAPGARRRQGRRERRDPFVPSARRRRGRGGWRGPLAPAARKQRLRRGRRAPFAPSSRRRRGRTCVPLAPSAGQRQGRRGQRTPCGMAARTTQPARCSRCGGSVGAAATGTARTAHSCRSLGGTPMRTALDGALPSLRRLWRRASTRTAQTA